MEIMLQILGADTVNSPIKSVAVAKRRPNGRDYAKAKKNGGRNVLWKRLTATIDEALLEAKLLPPDQIDKAVAIMAACTKLTSPVSRLVFMGHLTVTQGMAARRYAGIIAKFERYHVDGATRSARAQDIDRGRGGEDHEIERHLNNGTIDDYERRARRAKREYEKALTVLNRYRHEISGRNEAKNILDDLCLSDIEPPAQYRENVAAVLQGLASAFGVREKR
jgi:hypothetical protein